MSYFFYQGQILVLVKNQVLCFSACCSLIGNVPWEILFVFSFKILNFFSSANIFPPSLHFCSHRVDDASGATTSIQNLNCSHSQCAAVLTIHLFITKEGSVDVVKLSSVNVHVHVGTCVRVCLVSCVICSM